MTGPVISRTFHNPLVREYSASPTAEPLGLQRSTMDLWLRDAAGAGFIEWDIPDLEETYHIGLWWDPHTMQLTDYDGLFSLPEPAIAVLEEYGIKVGEEFR